jgi:hypothetical protein
MRVRRLVVVSVAYGAGALVVDLLVRGLVPILVLPPVTLILGRALLALGFVVTLAAAWSYRPPEGRSDDTSPEREG